MSHVLPPSYRPSFLSLAWQRCTQLCLEARIWSPKKIPPPGTSIAAAGCFQ